MNVTVSFSKVIEKFWNQKYAVGGPYSKVMESSKSLGYIVCESQNFMVLTHPLFTESGGVNLPTNPLTDQYYHF